VKVRTVTEPVAVEEIQLADAHGHVWIDPPVGINPKARFELTDHQAIEAELKEYHQAGGTAIVDCQPGGCGRDAKMLARLAEETGLYITATTGFHRQIYYPDQYWLWSASESAAADYFVEELLSGTRETDGEIPATTIKVGYEGVIEGQTRILMEAVAEAARQTGALILFHTEQGRNIEALPAFFDKRGVAPDRSYLCHVDRRPDFGLHRELAQAGVLLGYDTFIRPNYNPDQGVWPLIQQMVEADLTNHIAVGLDLGIASMWRSYGGQPGLLALPEKILPRLHEAGINDSVIAQLTGQNVARYLVWRT
jgi:predicted metal-dependent phosphotriesterase family hydrolase